MFMDMESIHDYPHEIWFSNIDSANPIFRCISKSTPVAARDPEYFITDHGPIIYFNQYDPALPKSGRLARSLANRSGRELSVRVR